MNKELSILQSYYRAMSSQDLHKTISFLDKNVRVCFQDEDKNWSGSTIALKKFEDMFKRWPSFHGSYSILKEDRKENYLEVKLACKFSCKLTNMTSNRDMIYHITESAIVYISHI